MGTPVLLGDIGVFLWPVFCSGQRVLELQAIKGLVVAPGLVARPVLRVDSAANGPERALLALDPDHDRLLRTCVVDAVDDPFGEAALRRFPPHKARIQST